MSRFESLVEQQIRAAQERGEFDNLPGAGKPLPGKGEPNDELWWVRGYLKREGLPTDALLPTGLQLAKQVERLEDELATHPTEWSVRETVADLNRRIAEYVKAPDGPLVPVRPLKVDEWVARWRATR
jgi:hypothetical protein